MSVRCVPWQQKPAETAGFGRQDSSGPHTLSLLHASTTQLLATRSHLPPAGAANAEHMPTPGALKLADLTEASVIGEAGAAAADNTGGITGDACAELNMTPPPLHTPPTRPQVCTCLQTKLLF